MKKTKIKELNDMENSEMTNLTKGGSKMNYTGEELVNYSGNTLQIGGTNYPIGDYYYPIYNEYYHNWYPTHTFITEKSKIEQGFKIVGKLLENKIITKDLTIKEFIKLVNDIAELL